MFSRRSAHDLSPNRLSLAVAARRANGAELLDLTVSNPTRAGIPYAPNVASALARSDEVLSYEPDPFGLPAARAAVSELWRERGLVVPPERVALTASTSEAYAFVFKLLCDPGDQVLVPAPSYPLLEHLGALESVELVPYRLGYDGAWFIDVNEVRARVTERTRAIVLVSPNNPTGTYLKRDELARLAALGLPLVSDEVFGDYPFGEDARRARSVLEADGGLVIALDGLSKAAALPQMKLAWLTLGGAPELVTAALGRLEVALDAFLSPSTPVQRALPELLATRGTAAGAVRARVRANLTSVRALCEGEPVSLLPVEGGWYAVLRLPATATDEEWALRALAAGVLVQPGYFFDFADEPHAVVSLLTPAAPFERGIRALVALAREA
ncbi:MAG TPA: pyridoxal phosphate-dependent aminotransferase [Polyangiaceae bacterium]|nr:pyridoxal phosphate-dependent aminotransferase [Polyangiaceae bacterium]